MAWNSNNRAHACLWLFEIWDKNQRDAGFDEVGEWHTPFIIEFTVGGSPELKAVKARSHAEKLDGVFTALYRACYEQGADRTTAIEEMEAVLNDGSKIMADLADIVDANYKFLGEI